MGLNLPEGMVEVSSNREVAEVLNKVRGRRYIIGA